MSQEPDEGQLLRNHLFEADLIQLPVPEEGIPGFLPEWFTGTIPAVVYPPLSERDIPEGGTVDLQVTPFTIYYGALRELAETADQERGDMLRRVVLEWHPEAALEVCELARGHIEANVETALLHYELALELDENLYEAAQDAGMCEYALSTAADEDRDDRLSAAEELFRRAVELRPEAGLSWWSLARTLHDQGETEEARQVLQQFLREQPEGEQRDMVEHALESGFELPEPSDEQVTFQQAQALAFSDQPEEAVKLLAPLAENYPDSGEIWFILGVAHRRSGDAEEAERCLRRAARLVPAEPFVWMELSRAYEAMEQWRPAEDAIRKALELDTSNAGYLCALGRFLLRQGDRFGAEEALGQARELVPDDPEVLQALKELEGQ